MRLDMKVQERKIISVENINKKFNTHIRKGIFKRERKEIKVVKDISFDIFEGEVVGFLGPNGAGKSTTIKMLTGIITPSSGRCLINGIEPYKERVKNARNIGVVFGQRTSLWWDMSLQDNLELLKEIYDVTDEEYNLRMEYLEELLGFKKLLNKQIRTMSLGQRMLSDLVGALIYKPKILFLDEPTIGIDIILKEKLLNILKEINKKEKITIILTTHDMRDVEALCDRIVIINEGEKIFDDTMENLVDKYVNEKIIKVTLKDKVDIDKIKEINGVLSINYEDNLLSINILKDVLVEKKVIMSLYDMYNIEKLELEEEDITSVVKKIYQTKI